MRRTILIILMCTIYNRKTNRRIRFYPCCSFKSKKCVGGYRCMIWSSYKINLETGSSSIIIIYKTSSHIKYTNELELYIYTTHRKKQQYATYIYISRRLARDSVENLFLQIHLKTLTRIFGRLHVPQRTIGLLNFVNLFNILESFRF